MKKKVAIIIIIIITILSAILFKWKRSEDFFFYAGTIEATKIDISSRLSSTISHIYVKEGELIEKDKVLANLSCEDITIAEDQANKDWQRAVRLFQSKLISLENYEHIKGRFDEANLKKSWCEVKAVTAGTIMTSYHEEGEWVSPGTKLFTLANLNDLWAYIYIPATHLGKITLGQKLEGKLPELDNQPVEVSITKISDEAEFTPKNVQTQKERERLLFRIKVKLPNLPKIKPGMTVEVKIN